MKVVFLNRFFYPDISPTSQILSDLAFHLAVDRHVHVITSRLKYDQRDEHLAASERIRDVTVHRVWTSRFGRASLVGRAIDYFTYYLSATLRLFVLVNRGDVVVSMTDPPLISVPASIVARLKGARVINWLQDIFPEVAAELDFKHLPTLAGNALAWLRDRSLSTAMCNVVLGDLMAAKVRQRAIPAGQIRVIHNWSSGEQIRPLAPDRNPLRREWGLDGKYVVGYSGNMGRVHEFAALLDAAGQLSGRRDIVFLLIGGGRQRAQLEAEVHSRGMSNVRFYPYQPREMLAHTLTVPDCHIVSLKPSLEGLIVPSKLYSSLAAGRPVIFLGARDGEIPRLMNANPAFGIWVAPDDVAGLVGAIERLSANPDQSAAFGTTGRQLFERYFDQPIALAKWTSLIAELGA